MWENFLKAGKVKEAEFADCLIKNLGGETILANWEDDIKHHIDLYWNYQSVLYKIDVKSMKKIDRKDSNPDENYHWIELQNVNGDKGWLFGDQDYIAFETEDYWILVTPNRIKNLLNKKIQNWDETQDKVPYRVYRRRNRIDKIVLVKTIDLIAIANKILWK